MNTIIGIDVSKHELSIYASDQHFSIGNNEKSLDEWCSTYNALLSNSPLIAYEATGGYEKLLSRYLEKHNLPGYRLHANHVRAYAKAMGILAKTDEIDAKVIAEFAQIKALTPKSSSLEHPDLLGLVQRREQLMDIKKQERNRLETADCRYLIQDIKAHIKQIDSRISRAEKAINAYIAADEDLKTSVDRLMTIPGIGLITAVSVYVYLPEIASIEDKSLACLAGLAPINKDSGKKTGKRKIHGGRSQVRRVLYMAVMSAKRYNPVIKDFYDRLIGKGKFYKVAMTAAMRKLLMIMRSVIIRETPWQTERP